MQHRHPRLRFIFQASALALTTVLLLGPQVVLQLTAWSYMLVSYTQQSSVQEAVVDTFSGERPCDLCHLIEAVEADDETPALGTRATDDFRLLIPRLERRALPARPRMVFEHPGHESQPRGAHWPIPGPPPKALS